MACSRNKSAAAIAKFGADLLVAARLASLLVVFMLTSPAARAADSAVAALNQQCLGCHSMQGMEKKLASKETLSLHVDGPAFAQSVHNKIGCAVCHSNISFETHPSVASNIASSRDYSLARAKVCQSCHAAIFKQYEGSIHAALLRDGNPGAPVCTDCHSPHATMAKAAYDAASGDPCSKCHDKIFTAFTGSVHKQAALACSNCHRAHDVSAATAADQLKSACLGCHQDTQANHQKWLPNAGLHFDAVSCAACHSPTAKRKVDLRLYDDVARQRVAEKAGVPQFESRARSAATKGASLDAMALHSLLREFNREGIDSKITLRGRLEVSTGAEAHQLARSTQAIRDCAKCHQQGADPFQSVTVSIVGPDGRPVRYGAQAEVLNSMISVDSLGGFYAIGGTRIVLLDWLLALALLGGISVPIGHLTLNWLFRRYAKKISGKEDS